MIDDVKDFSGEIYKTYAEKSSNFRYKFFPYFKLVRSYGVYQYHFLVIRKDHHFFKKKINVSHNNRESLRVQID